MQSPTEAAGEEFARALESQRGRLWGLAYRMLGDGEEAKDVVQESYARAVEHAPPVHAHESGLAAWLTTVATRMCIDRLRRRKAKAYDGPWLPIPVRELPVLETEAAKDADPELCLCLRESASLAVLWALEALEPKARAAVLLSAVFGYTGPELAEVLGLSEANVRVTLHRARKILREGKAASEEAPIDAAAWPELMGRMMTAIANEDLNALEILFTEDVQVVNDANGMFRAARQVVHGARDAARFFIGITKKSGAPGNVLPLQVNGGLAFWTEREPKHPRDSRVSLLSFSTRGGKICASFAWLAPEKLANLDPKC